MASGADADSFTKADRTAAGKARRAPSGDHLQQVIALCPHCHGLKTRGRHCEALGQALARVAGNACHEWIGDPVPRPGHLTHWPQPAGCGSAPPTFTTG
ncbi:hypothetical protein [Streptomyces sulphureus]|uniref:hypothetical protein n=1 Tax=Streptomyces sulphureus TaxID=47758 RepID=UPI0003A5A014|nr:hypothetical protein [Streptomyces sulphureus]